MTLFACICTFGNVSGGHFNPAVTMGVYFKEGKKSNTGFALMIILAEFVGAALGVLIIFFANKKETILKDDYLLPGIARLCPESL